MNLPTFFTFLNIFSGFMAIISASEMKIEWAFWFIVFSAIFDFFDGKLARILKTSSQLGPQVDSLADVVSFGVAPAYFIYSFVVFPLGRFTPYYLLPLIYISAVVMRLARFNIIGEESQRESYLGLSSPISAIFLISLTSTLNQFFSSFPLTREVVTGAIILLSFLMLSKIEFPVFKTSKKAEKIQILLFFVGILLTVYLKYILLLVITSIYIIGGIIFYVFSKDEDE